MFALKQGVAPAAPSRAANTPALKPEPQKGALDFATMRRSAISRFPKTLARLAE
jgi:hypothetical protein